MNSDPHHPQCLEQFLIHSRCSIGIYYIEKEDTLVRSRSQHSSRSLTKGYSGLCPTIFIPISFFPPRRTNKHSHHSPICLSFMRFLCIIFDCVMLLSLHIPALFTSMFILHTHCKSCSELQMSVMECWRLRCPTHMPGDGDTLR